MAKRHAHRDGKGQFTTAHVPDADTSVTDLSGHAQAEHERPADATVYPDPVTGHAGRRIPQRQARMIDGSRHDFDHEARGFDTLAGGHLRSRAFVQAAQGDEFIIGLVGDQRAPAARQRGMARYRATIARTGRTTQDDAQDDGGHPSGVSQDVE